MAVVPGAGPGTLTQLAPFRTYHLDAAHDEMFDGHGLPRAALRRACSSAC